MSLAVEEVIEDLGVEMSVERGDFAEITRKAIIPSLQFLAADQRTVVAPLCSCNSVLRLAVHRSGGDTMGL